MKVGCPDVSDSLWPRGSSVHGILHSRILEWIAISFSRGSSQTRDQTRVSCIAGRRFNFWATREAQSIWKRNQLWIFIGRLMLELKLQYFCHQIWRANSLKKILMLGKSEGKRERGQQKMRWLGSISDSVDMTLSKLREIVKDKEACCAAIHGVAKGRTWLSDWTTTMVRYIILVHNCPKFEDYWYLKGKLYMNMWAQNKKGFKIWPLFFTRSINLSWLSGRVLLSTNHIWELHSFPHLLLIHGPERDLCNSFL